MDIKYDAPIEVTKEQYDRIKIKFAGLVAHRVDSDGRYWIKLWHMKYRVHLENELL